MDFMVMARSSAPTTSLIACHDCDLLHRRQRIEEGAAAKCSRCGAVLYRNPRDGIQRTLVFSLGALILYVLANVYVGGDLVALERPLASRKN